MKKALVVYQSKTGITEKFAGEISKYLNEKGIKSQAVSVKDYKEGTAEESDYLLLGCWTAGFMLLFQHPDGDWKKFAGSLPTLSCSKVALFTTYKIATGSMFKSMRKHLNFTNAGMFHELKSKKGDLTVDQINILDRFISEN